MARFCSLFSSLRNVLPVNKTFVINLFIQFLKGLYYVIYILKHINNDTFKFLTIIRSVIFIFKIKEA